MTFYMRFISAIIDRRATNIVRCPIIEDRFVYSTIIKKNLFRTINSHCIDTLRMRTERSCSILNNLDFLFDICSISTIDWLQDVLMSERITDKGLSIVSSDWFSLNSWLGSNCVCILLLWSSFWWKQRKETWSNVKLFFETPGVLYSPSNDDRWESSWKTIKLQTTTKISSIELLIFFPYGNRLLLISDRLDLVWRHRYVVRQGILLIFRSFLITSFDRL